MGIIKILKIHNARATNININTRVVKYLRVDRNELYFNAITLLIK